MASPTPYIKKERDPSLPFAPSPTPFIKKERNPSPPRAPPPSPKRDTKPERRSSIDLAAVPAAHGVEGNEAEVENNLPDGLPDPSYTFAPAEPLRVEVALPDGLPAPPYDLAPLAGPLRVEGGGIHGPYYLENPQDIFIRVCKGKGDSQIRNNFRWSPWNSKVLVVHVCGGSDLPSDGDVHGAISSAIRKFRRHGVFLSTFRIDNIISALQSRHDWPARGSFAEGVKVTVCLGVTVDVYNLTPNTQSPSAASRQAAEDMQTVQEEAADDAHLQTRILQEADHDPGLTVSGLWYTT